MEVTKKVYWLTHVLFNNGYKSDIASYSGFCTWWNKEHPSAYWKWTLPIHIPFIKLNYSYMNYQAKFTIGCERFSYDLNHYGHMTFYHNHPMIARDIVCHSLKIEDLYTQYQTSLLLHTDIKSRVMTGLMDGTTFPKEIIILVQDYIPYEDLFLCPRECRNPFFSVKEPCFQK